MDTRTERSAINGEMIGRTQMLALKRWLDKNSQRVKFVITSVPFFPDKKAKDDDKWAGYPSQRLSILNYLAKHQISKTIFLSGDIHVSGSATITCPQIPTFSVHQIISSPVLVAGVARKLKTISQ